MNTPVSFPLAKLLKEKGFDIPIQHSIADKNYVYDVYTQDFVKNITTNIISNWNDEKYQKILSAPTIAEVVMWLYEKHEMWIDVSLNQFSKPEDLQWMYSIVFTEDCTYSHSPKSYTSPTEAYEAAIKDTLENII